MLHDNHHRSLCHRLQVACCALFLAGTAWAAQTTRLVQGGLILDGVPAADPALAERLQQWQQSRPLRLLCWMSDGSLLVAGRLADAEQVLRVRAALQAPEPLSTSAGAIVAVGAQPFANESLAVAKTDAAGQSGFYLLEIAAQRERQLAGAADRVSSLAWAHDGKRIAYSSYRRTGANADLYVVNTENGPAQLIASGGGNWQALDWSLDDRFLLALRQEASGNEQLQLVELATGIIRALVPEPPQGAAARGQRVAAVPGALVHVSRAIFAPDGASVLALSDEGSQVLRLQLRGIDGRDTQILSPPMNRDVEHFALSADARYLAYDYQERGQSRLILLDRRAGREKVISGLPNGTINDLKFDLTGARLAINIETPTSPADVYVLDLSSGKAERWTHSDPGPAGLNALSIPVPFRFRTVDSPVYGGFEPNALIYRPVSAVPHTQPLPTLIMLPSATSQSVMRFDAQLQMLVSELGVAVVVPVLRRAGGKMVPEASVRDIGALLAWISLQPDLDHNRVAILGSGDVSAVALAALARFGDRLRRAVVVDGAPVVTDAQHLQRPVLIARGFQTPAMPEAQAELLLWRVRAGGSEGWLVSNSQASSDAAGVAGAASSSASMRRVELARVLVQFLVR